jgi:protein-disulfide isomerase
MVKKMQVVGSRIRLLTHSGLAALIMAVLIAVSGSSSSTSKPLALERSQELRTHPPLEEEAAKRIEALYAGIPQQGDALGNPKAPVTLQFFGDLECEEARQFVLGALPLLIRHWVRGGELRIEYRAYPAETIWPDIYNNQEVAVLAAGEQEMSWQYLDFFYHEQGLEFTRYAINHFLQAIAKGVPDLGFAQWTTDRHRRRLDQQVTRDLRIAQAHHIYYTPAFLIGPTGGKTEPLLHFSFTETAAFDEAVERMLQG